MLEIFHNNSFENLNKFLKIFPKFKKKKSEILFTSQNNYGQCAHPFELETWTLAQGRKVSQPGLKEFGRVQVYCL